MRKINKTGLIGLSATVVYSELSQDLSKYASENYHLWLSSIVLYSTEQN